MRVYILDAHALVALPEVVQPSTLGEVFGVMSALVHASELLITKSVIEVLRRLAPNEPSCIWAGTIMELRRHVKVDYSWQMLAQEAAQDAGYDDGLDDVLAALRYPYPIQECGQCGSPYMPKGPRQATCSPSCGQRLRYADSRQRSPNHGHDRKRARRFGVKYEPVNRRKVYERDKWRCGICKRKVNPNLKYPHAMSASLDHIIPMSLGGSHVYSNVQCAHWKCNHAKRAAGAVESSYS